MANFKICVRNIRQDGLYSAYIRITHNRSVAYIKTDKIVAKEYLDSHGNVSDDFVLRYCGGLLSSYIERLNGIDISHMTAKEVKDLLRSGADVCSFSEFALRYTERLCNRGQLGTWKAYTTAVKSLERFVGSSRILFSSLTYGVLSAWIDSLENTRRAKSLYPTCIRQIFNEAYTLRDDPTERMSLLPLNPWTKIGIPEKELSEKRAVPAEECRIFFSWSTDRPKCTKRQQVGRDVAMLSICLAGMNTVDIYNLKKSDYYGGVLHYRRSKTKSRRNDGAYFEIRVPEILKSVIDRYYAPKKSDYLFCFAEWYSDAVSFNAVVNYGIKLVCKELGLPDNYSFYTFRHTWATTAQNDCGANLAEIGFAMNHSQHHKTTRGYVKFDFRPAWELNEKVIDFILFSDKPSSRKKNESESETMFKLSPKMLIRACAFFRGRCVASFEDIGCGSIDVVISRLVADLPDDIPVRSMVQFKIVNLDNGKVATYERMKGKGF